MADKQQSTSGKNPPFPNPSGTHPFDRSSEICAREVINSILPQADIRRPCLQLLVDSIKLAHTARESSWGVTLFEDGAIRLNVGMIEVCTLSYGELVRLLVDYKVLGDIPAKYNLICEMLANQANIFDGVYSSVPGSVILEFLAHNLGPMYSLAKKSYTALIMQAAETARNPSTRGAHSPGVLKYLRSELKQPIPDPVYPAPKKSKRR